MKSDPPHAKNALILPVPPAPPLQSRPQANSAAHDKIADQAAVCAGRASPQQR